MFSSVQSIMRLSQVPPKICRSCIQHVIRDGRLRQNLDAVQQIRTFANSSDVDQRRRPYIPRRALMYVPGSDERKIQKIPKLGADCVCIDCEDGVAFGMKDQARRNIRKLLEEKKSDFFGRSELTVRVNSITSGLVQDDVQVIFGGLQTDGSVLIPSAIHLPKVDSPHHLFEFADIFAKATKLDSKSNVRIGLIMFIESAQALINLVDICKSASQLTEESILVPEALVFGSDDFVADIGATRTMSASELMYARQKMVTVGKAFELQVIDLVHIDYKDMDGLRAQSEEGARMGFTGKQVIHPAQLEIVQKSFSPSQERIEWATALIAGFREHEAQGKGAFNFRGHMIDMPLVKQAQKILDMKKRME